MKRVRVGVVLFASVCLAWFVGGCASLGGVSPNVSVNLINALPTQASLLETSAALTLRFTNESPQPLLVAGGVHRLYLNDSYVGRAVSSERLTVPALGTTTQTVTIHLENLTLLRKLAEFSHTSTPRIAYRLESKLHPAEGAMFGGLRTLASGELDLTPFLEARNALPLTP